MPTLLKLTKQSRHDWPTLTMIPPFTNVRLEKRSNEAQSQEQGDYPEAMERSIDVTFKGSSAIGEPCGGRTLSIARPAFIHPHEDYHSKPPR
jgi:hypothetical protein